MQKLILLSLTALYLSVLSLTAQHAPVANAGEDITVSPCATVTLNATATDEDGTSTFYYNWEVPAALKDFVPANNLNSNQLNFYPPPVTSVTSYTIKLYASDGTLTSAADEVILTLDPSLNHPPVIDEVYSALTEVDITAQDAFLNFYSVDPDNYYELKPIIEITTTNEIINSEHLTINILSPPYFTGSKVFNIKYWVEDCLSKSEVKTLDVTINQVDNVAPTSELLIGKAVNTIESYSFFPGDSIGITIKATDVNFDTAITFALSCPTGITCPEQVDEKGLIVPLPTTLSPGTYTFSLTASDGRLTSAPVSASIEVKSTASKADDYVKSMYDVLRTGDLWGVNFYTFYYGVDDRLMHERTYYDNYSIKNHDDLLYRLYKGLTNGVNHSFTFLNKLNTLSLSADQKNQLEAEARFLRGLYNFYLAICFADHPLMDKESGVTGWHHLDWYPDTFYSSSKEALYNAAIEDLSFAIGYLPTSYTGADRYRATKGAAQAMLGKVYLYKQDWANAKLTFGEVISSGTYNLVWPKAVSPSDYILAYECNFMPIDTISKTGNTYTSEFNQESVFEIPYEPNAVYNNNYNPYLPGWMTEGSVNGAYFGINGYRNVGVVDSFLAEYEVPAAHPAGLTIDPRAKATYWKDGDTLDTRPGTEYYNELYSYYMYGKGWHYGLKKYYSPIHSEGWGAPMVDPNNRRLIRYADVLLMYAEACYHTGDLSDGLDALNLVRQRAGMPDAPALTPAAIIHERDIELAAEGVRFHDLIRWMNLPTPWVTPSVLGPNFEKSEDAYFPVPIRLISSALSPYIVPENRKAGDIISSFDSPGNATTALTDYYGFELDNDNFSTSNNKLITSSDLDWNTQKVYTICKKDVFAGKDNIRELCEINIARQLQQEEMAITNFGDSITTIQIDVVQVLGKVNIKDYNTQTIMGDGNLLPDGISFDFADGIFTFDWKKLAGSSLHEVILYNSVSNQNTQAVFFQISDAGGVIEQHQARQTGLKFLVWPTINNGEFNIRALDSAEETGQLNVTLYSLAGRAMASQQLSSFDHLGTMQFAGLQRGVYLVNIQSANSSEMHRIIVE